MQSILCSTSQLAQAVIEALASAEAMASMHACRVGLTPVQIKQLLHTMSLRVMGQADSMCTGRPSYVGLANISVGRLRTNYLAVFHKRPRDTNLRFEVRINTACFDTRTRVCRCHESVTEFAALPVAKHVPNRLPSHPTWLTQLSAC